MSVSKKKPGICLSGESSLLDVCSHRANGGLHMNDFPDSFNIIKAKG